MIIDNEIFKRRCGVYIWRRQSQVLYVGQSTDVHRRLITHPVINKLDRVRAGDVIEVVECAPHELVGLETELTIKYKPSLNSTQKSRKLMRQAEEDLIEFRPKSI